MRISVFPIALVAAMAGAAGGSEPIKDAPRPTTPAPAAAPVVLASASDARRPSPTETRRSADPVRRPAPRVTSCRCGDPQASDERSGDSQPDE